MITKEEKSEIESILDVAHVDAIVGQMWKHAFHFSKREPFLSLQQILNKTIEHWNPEQDYSDNQKMLCLCARDEFIISFKEVSGKL